MGEWDSGSHRSFRSVDDLNTVAPRNETPASMLENYLGKGRYEPAPVKERHSVGYYALVGASLLVVFALVLFLTITYLA